MPSMLELSEAFPAVELAAGEVVLKEKEKSDRLVVLTEGAIEVFRGDVTIALVTEPGAIFGEMSLLLDIPHTASVRAVGPATVRIIENAMNYLAHHTAMLVPIAQLLARRLQGSTTYLVDLKRQFEHHKDHFGMVDEVLESLTHQQDHSFMPDGDLPSEPS